MLARSHGHSGGNWSTHNYYQADGNGNITFMLNSSQAMVASYRYDPFGNTIQTAGTLANQNVYRFSSKQFHTVSGLYYYGYRWYDPTVQRWLNRDPIGEWDGPNLYTFTVNCPLGMLTLTAYMAIPFRGPRVPSVLPGRTTQVIHTTLRAIFTRDPHLTIRPPAFKDAKISSSRITQNVRRPDCILV